MAPLPNESVILADKSKGKGRDARTSTSPGFGLVDVWSTRKNNRSARDDQLVFFFPRRQCEVFLNFARFEGLFAFFKSIVRFEPRIPLKCCTFTIWAYLNTQYNSPQFAEVCRKVFPKLYKTFGTLISLTDF